MKDQYYSLPLSLGSIIEGRPHQRCSLHDGIYQHLYLLMISYFDETRYDPRYGCALWDHDFSIMTSIKWKDLIRESVEESIQRFEPRITQAKVRIEMDEYEVMTKKEHYVRKRVGVEVKATIRQTNEPFTFFEKIYISPMSQE